MMALLYHATLTPSKTELLQPWLPHQPWFDGADASSMEAVGAYRFDDPDGKVGIETHLLRAGDGQIFQVPVTYRDAPLAGAESWLVGTTQHSVLGERWVYDACGDPVYVTALATVVLLGGTQADIAFVTDNGPEPWEATTLVSGSGSPEAAVPPLVSVSASHEGATTVITSSHLELTVLRAVGAGGVDEGSDRPRLTGTWPGQDSPALLASARFF